MTSALKDVPITQFEEPAPIVAVPDAARRRQRGGFEPGRQRPRDVGEGGPYVEEPEAPIPESPTTTEAPTTTTTVATGGTGGGLLFPP
jgi:hypothetical protein